MMMNGQPALAPERKRSALVAPLAVGALVIGGAAIWGNGTFSSSTPVTNNAANVAAVPNAASTSDQIARGACGMNRIDRTVEQCQAFLPGTSCAENFSRGTEAVGLTRTSSGPWEIVALRRDGVERYVDTANRRFEEGHVCSASNGTSRVPMIIPFVVPGSNSQRTGLAPSPRTAPPGMPQVAPQVAPSNSQNPAVQRSGFGSTARSTSISSGG